MHRQRTCRASEGRRRSSSSAASLERQPGAARLRASWPASPCSAAQRAACEHRLQRAATDSIAAGDLRLLVRDRDRPRPASYALPEQQGQPSTGRARRAPWARPLVEEPPAGQPQPRAPLPPDHPRGRLPGAELGRATSSTTTSSPSAFATAMPGQRPAAPAAAATQDRYQDRRAWSATPAGTRSPSSPSSGRRLRQRCSTTTSSAATCRA